MIVLLVPYRNRETDRATLLQRFRPNVARGEFEIFFVHQRDDRPFNRGAMKNIGFMAFKERYPDRYHDITFVFHDVDVYPREGVDIPYDTSHGAVAHYYGFRFALGGIFAIKGADFERTNGFPSFWGWGLEDNVMQHRCVRSKLTIDRSHFYPIGDPSIVHTVDGYEREVSRRDANTYFKDKAERNGLTSIRNVRTTFEGDMIHVDAFETGTGYQPDDFFTKDIRKGNVLRMTRPNRMPMRFL